MKIEFRKPTEIDAKEIATWKYEAPYSFYDNDKTEAKQLWALNVHKEENAYTMYNGENQLIGNCSFWYDEEDGRFMVGLQMNPIFTGKGLGVEHVKEIVNFGREKYKFDELGLLVAKFNKRAIKVYEKLEFKIIDEFLWHVNEEDTEFYTMKKNWNEAV